MWRALSLAVLGSLTATGPAERQPTAVVTFTASVVPIATIATIETTLPLGFTGIDIEATTSGEPTMRDRFVYLAADGRAVVTALGSSIEIRAAKEALAFRWPLNSPWPSALVLAARKQQVLAAR